MKLNIGNRDYFFDRNCSLKKKISVMLIKIHWYLSSRVLDGRKTFSELSSVHIFVYFQIAIT